MTRSKLATLLAGTLLLPGLLLAGDIASVSGNKTETFKTKLDGYQEVPTAISTSATGSFIATLSEDGTSLEYDLSYSDFEGAIQQGHIHFGRPAVTGGILVWLCQAPPNFADPTGLAPPCPEEGTVTGTLTSANVLEIEKQGIEAGNFEEFIDALRARAGYVNLHSDRFPAGEIRGDIKKSGASDRERP